MQSQKSYPQDAAMMLNVANDIVEMYKAKVTVDNDEQFGFETEMYGKKASYLFWLTKQVNGCLLSIETPGDDERAKRRLLFMFSMVDTRLALLDQDD